MRVVSSAAARRIAGRMVARRRASLDFPAPGGPEEPGTLAANLAIQPQRGGATAIVEAEVGRIVLYVRSPGAGEHDGDGEYIVLLLRNIPLNVKDELLALLKILGPPLLLQHGQQLGIVDMAAVRGWSGTYMAYSALSGSQAMLMGPVAIPSYLPANVVAI